MNIRRLCVFCGSAGGLKPEYAQAAAELGRTAAAHGIELVYGGGRVGLMGTLADACLAAGGAQYRRRALKDVVDGIEGERRTGADCRGAGTGRGESVAIAKRGRI